MGMTEKPRAAFGTIRPCQTSAFKESDMSYQLRDHPVVPHEKWVAARSALLAKEKEFSLLREELAQKRRELPWEKVEKPYTFVGPAGAETLAQLFGPRSQLLVYHFMFAPESEAGCSHCSL